MRTTFTFLAAVLCWGLSPLSVKADVKPDCPDNSCFETRILSQETQANCTTYTLEISSDGACPYALSHYSIETGCGQVTDVSNSEGWAMEVGTIDPTTGISGIKVDDIKGFGEGDSPQVFTVTYTICNNGGCESEALFPARVAYKAAICVHYQEVSNPYTPMSGAITATQPKCAGSSNGAAQLEVSGGQTPFSFVWSNGATTEDLQNIAAGTYSVTVTDAKGETLSLETTLSSPEVLSLQSDVTSISCNGSGSVTVSPAGGTAPYSYLWSNGSTAATLEATTAGTYSLTLTDANGCTLTGSYTITQESLQLSIAGGQNCQSSELTASVTGGTAPYTYEWSTGETTAAISYTSGGTYELTVTDASGCSSSQSVTVADPSNAISLSYSTTDLLCYGDSNAGIDLSVSGGSGEYTYEWSNGQTTEDLTNLGAGTYQVTVTDAGGCTSTASITITAPRPIYIRPIETTNISCNGDAGQITVSASYGTAPYTYEWSNGSTEATATFTSTGYYTVTVTDANGCSAERRFYMRENSVPAVSISSTGCGDNYTLSASATGGTSPYTYSWAGGETGSSISGAPGNTYTVTVTDAGGCSSTASYTLQEATSPLSLQAATTNVSCAGGNDGTASLTVNGGVAPYTFDWSSGHNSQAAANLTAGIYSVQVTDANGCSEVLAFTITEPQPLNITAVVENNSSCGMPAGSISVSVNGGAAPYSYIWNNGSQSSNLEGLAAGSYTLTLIDANKCVAIRSFTIVDEAGSSAPTASLQNCADTVISRGSTASLPVYFEGEGPYTLRYTAGNKEQSITTMANPYLLEVSPQSKTTYSLLSVSNSCGEGSASGQATIQVSDASKTTVCEDGCFDTKIISSTTEGSCKTITLQVNAGADCRYGLSHFNVAVGCGSVSNVSNSEGWPMELNAYDPTTGLYGIKVDDIKGFSENESFTVTYTLCSDGESCQEAQNSCGPLVAYKAGTCVYYDRAEEGTATEQPGGGWGEIVILPDFELYPNPYAEGQELNVKINDLSKESQATLTIISLTGTEVLRAETTVSPQNNVIRVLLNYVPSGTYVVMLEVQGHVITKQLYVL
ncbi:T9SS type A sorting domain-containing protein [Nafulsella turpanensis]|uniref:T9SS type A sorting domain-containing protein n=1 Tax=Nafulsella turpanensis TaxID=1265690 RepID=UPI00135F172D|nr:T9SS type A sorting domain-containing protein [Nafulsella turpanensis]